MDSLKNVLPRKFGSLKAFVKVHYEEIKQARIDGFGWGQIYESIIENFPYMAGSMSKKSLSPTTMGYAKEIGDDFPKTVIARLPSVGSSEPKTEPAKDSAAGKTEPKPKKKTPAKKKKPAAQKSPVEPQESPQDAIKEDPEVSVPQEDKNVTEECSGVSE